MHNVHEVIGADESSRQGATDIRECKAGQFSASGDKCKPCPAGSYADQEGSSGCKDCTAGYSCPREATAPTPCLAVKFSAAKAGRCDDCTAGHKCPTEATTTPTPCDAGIYAAAGAIGCTPCVAGKYLNSSGSCINCPADTFSGIGATSCINCPDGQTSFAGASCTCEPFRVKFFDKDVKRQKPHWRYVRQTQLIIV